MVKSYKMQHDINAEKQVRILAVLDEYRITASKIASVMWYDFFKNSNRFDKDLPTNAIKSKLSERFKRNAAYQVCGMLESFLSNRQNDFSKMVHNSTLDEEVKIQLYRINRRQLWFSKKEKDFTAAELFLAKKIFKHILSLHNKPSYGRINMILNSNVAKINKADKAKSPAFDYWINFSTLEFRKQIELPVITNPYFEKAEGELKAAVQVNKKWDGKLEIVFMKEVPAKKIDNFKTEKVAVDIGLRTLFALDNGNLLGRDFIDKLIEYDKVITDLAANRQRQGLNVSSDRYNLLVKRFHDYLQNEICRIINKMVDRLKPKILVFENLNFQNQKLSKRMNRLLANFGKSIIEKKLESLYETYGIEIQYVPAPYSSQECVDCGYVDSGNRPSQAKFECINCNKKTHADVKSARIHLNRSSDEKLSNIYLNKFKVLDILVMRFVTRHATCVSRCAGGLLHQNPYFKNYLEKAGLLDKDNNKVLDFPTGVMHSPNEFS